MLVAIFEFLFDLSCTLQFATCHLSPAQISKIVYNNLWAYY